MDWLLSNWLSIVGALASIVGFGLTLWQISLVKDISIAAKEASESTKDAITQNLFLVEISAMLHFVDEVITNLRLSQHDAALLRINDVIAQFQQMKSMPIANGNDEGQFFMGSIQQLVILRDSLNKYIETKGKRGNLTNASTILSNISGELNSLIGKTKYIIKDGVYNDR